MIDFSHENFSRILDDIGGIDRAARIDLIDRFDALRKASGRVEAYRWMNGLKDASLLHRIRRVATDPAAQRVVDGILQRNDPKEIRKMEARLSEEMIQDCAKWIGMTEEKIIEQAADLKERRNMRRMFKRSVSIVNIALKCTGKGGFPYCTPFEVEIRKQQAARLRKWASERVAVKKGSCKPLIELIENQSRHELAELYAFSRGLEKYSKSHGKKWSFWTLTAPARMHGNPSSGTENWDGTSPLKAHQWISKMWGDVEARARGEGVIISGFRVVEPHKDGCPHWHILIFADAKDLDTFEELVRSQRRAPSWASPDGAKEVRGDDSLGSAASYLFKYLKKSINDDSEEAVAADAWRAAHGIRGVQPFGLPPKGLWRALRDLKKCPEDTRLAAIWTAANVGDGEAFIRLSGGLNMKKKDRPIQYEILKGETEKTITVKTETGVIHSETLDRWFIFKEDETDLINQIRSGLDKEQEIGVIENYPREADASNTSTDGIEYLIIDERPPSNIIHQK